MPARIDDGLTNSERWKKRHPEKAKKSHQASQRRYVIKSPETAKATSKRSHKRWYDRNAAKRNEQIKKQRETVKHTARRRALIAKAEGDGISESDWKMILAAFGHRCAYCGVPSTELTQDHVIPISRHGHHSPRNIAPACMPCNSGKRDRLRLPVIYV